VHLEYELGYAAKTLGRRGVHPELEVHLIRLFEASRHAACPRPTSTLGALLA